MSLSVRKTAIVALASAALGFAIAIAVVLAWPGGGGGRSGQLLAQATVVSTPASPGGNSGASAQLALGSSCLSAADIYQQLRPSVVEIISTSSGSSSFGPTAQGEGSGIVLDTQGHILTNNHVVSGADSLEVRFADSTSASAHVVGTDPSNDLAVVQVENPSAALTAASLGDSSTVRVGDPVLAIGDPFRLQGTLTAGIISAIGRTSNQGNGTRPVRNMIQTDAPVNPGNSGGPLLDCQGKVIGVVTELINPTGQDVNVGIAFAVPSNTAQRFLPDMLSGSTVSHPLLGIAGEDITPALAKTLNLSVSSGVYVTLVSPASPAEQAGLHGAFQSDQAAAQSSSVPSGGDVIVAVDGQAVTGIAQLVNYLDTKKVGDTVELTLERGGNKSSVKATLAQWRG
jgi:S1-C subfamily serine protease